MSVNCKAIEYGGNEERNMKLIHVVLS